MAKNARVRLIRQLKKLAELADKEGMCLFSGAQIGALLAGIALDLEIGNYFIHDAFREEMRLNARVLTTDKTGTGY